MEPANTVIASSPSLLPSYAKALIKGNRYKEGRALPKLKYTWEGFDFPRAKITAYRETCRLPPGIEVPLFFPHSFLGAIHLTIMTHSDFPLKPLGSVHCRNHVIQYAPLRINTQYSASLEVVGQRRRPQGLEFDLRTNITSDGIPCWVSMSTYLVRMKLSGEDPASPLADCVTNLTEKKDLASFDVPRGVGKEFGRVTGDINPIHMSKLLAKAFGFKKDLAHGMWSIGRGLPFFTHLDHKAPIRYDVVFKGPLYLGEPVAIKEAPNQAGAFEYYGGKNERPSVVGYVRNVTADETLDI